MKCIYDVAIKSCFTTIPKPLQYLENCGLYGNVSLASQNNILNNQAFSIETNGLHFRLTSCLFANIMDKNYIREGILKCECQLRGFIFVLPSTT